MKCDCGREMYKLSGVLNVDYNNTTSTSIFEFFICPLCEDMGTEKSREKFLAHIVGGQPILSRKVNNNPGDDMISFPPDKNEIKRREFTCYNCSKELKCPYAFDLYNVNGDCLLIK